MALERRVRPNHLRPAAGLAERVLLPGDPALALSVAQALLAKPPKMYNHARGLWGYSGIAADGEPLTVQATGIGGPSAAVVCEELIALGARTLVQIGSCSSLDTAVEAGSLLAAEVVLPGDGASAALGAEAPLAPDPELFARLLEAGARPAVVASSDLFYDPRAGAAASWAARGALAVEMQAAAVLQVAASRGAAAACVLGVSGSASANGARRMGAEETAALGVRAAEAGYAAVRSR